MRVIFQIFFAFSEYMNFRKKNIHTLHCTVQSGAFKRGISKCGSWLDAKARYLLSLKSNLINAHRDALKANHLSVNSVAKKKKANKLFLPSGDNLLNFSQALHHLITRKWTFELNTDKDKLKPKPKTKNRFFFVDISTF